MTESLKQKTAVAIAWSTFERLGTQLIFFAIGILMARILSQSDYGLIGMVGIFSALSVVLIDGGFSSSLIRKTDATDLDFNSVFYFNIALSTFLYLILFFAAPYIADFYHQPQLTLIARVIFISLLINSLGLIQSSLLIKNVKFRQSSFANIISLFLSGILALSLAWKGYGVWALVWQNVSASFFKVSLLWIFGKWYPKPIFSFNTLRQQLRYSMETTTAGILGNIFIYLYSLLIGKFFPLAQLGNYTQAGKMSDMPINTLSGSIYNATFPIYSKIKDDPERLKRAFQKTIRLTAFISFPLLLGMALVGPNLLELLITRKWAEAFPYFQLLCIAGIPTIFTMIIQNFIRINERVTLFVYFEVAKFCILTITFLLTFQYGIYILVAGIIAMKVAIYFMNAFFIGRKVNYSMFEQIKDMLPTLGLSLIMIAICYPFSFIIENKILLISTQAIVGAIFYIGANKIFKSKILDDVISLVLKK